MRESYTKVSDDAIWITVPLAEDEPSWRIHCELARYTMVYKRLRYNYRVVLVLQYGAIPRAPHSAVGKDDPADH